MCWAPIMFSVDKVEGEASSATPHPEATSCKGRAGVCHSGLSPVRCDLRAFNYFDLCAVLNGKTECDSSAD